MERTRERLIFMKTQHSVLKLRMFLTSKVIILLWVTNSIKSCLLSFCLFRAAPKAHGGSQARGLTGAGAAGLHHSHSHVRSELQLGPMPQLTAALDH